MNNRLNILNVWIDPVDEMESIRRIEDFLENGNRLHTIFAINPEKNFSVPAEPLLYEAVKNADLLIPDGIGMVMAARLLHNAKLTRVAGFETMNNICRLAAQKGKHVFLYGATEKVNKRTAQKLPEMYPGLHIAGRSNGYVKDDAMGVLIEKINISGAEILFLALGSPHQEKWLTRYKNDLKHIKICQGVGGSFDVIAGTVKRSPGIWISCHIEWLYRLLTDPRRIKRQWVLPVFALQVAIEKIRLMMTINKE